MGLALRRLNGDFEIVGHDRESSAAARARKLGAVDKTEWNLINACEPANLIILALPVGAIRGTMLAIAYLQPGCVITDTANTKRQVLQWADEILPETVSFIGGDPIIGTTITDPEMARADLFEKATYCLIPSRRATEEAMQITIGLVRAIGANPYFVDGDEHDGLLSAVEHLPAILSMVLLQITTESPSWREMRRLAGSAFETATGFASSDASTYCDAFAINQTNLLRWIDVYLAQLAAFRELLAAGDQSLLQESARKENLRAMVSRLLTAREQWVRDRARGQWELDEFRVPTPEPPSMLGRLLGSGFDRLQKKK